MEAAQNAQTNELEVTESPLTISLDRDVIREELWQDVLTHPAQKGSYFVARYTAKYGVSRRTVYSWLKSLHKAKMHFCLSQADANRAATDYVETLRLVKESLWNLVADQNTANGTKVQAIRSLLACEQKLYDFLDKEGSNPLAPRYRNVVI